MVYGMLMGLGDARVAWVVPLAAPGLIQRFHVTIQSIHNTQRVSDRWIVAVVSDQVRGIQATRAVARVTNHQIQMKNGGSQPLVNYFVRGYEVARAYLLKTTTTRNDTMQVVWIDVDVLLVQAIALQSILVQPHQLGVLPSDTTGLMPIGTHFVVLGEHVDLLVDKQSLYATLKASGLPHVHLRATTCGLASEMHTYRDMWLAARTEGCTVPPRMDEVFCGVTSIYYNLATFGPWHWWTYPVVRINFPWSHVASHVDARNIPWPIWLLKISHFLGMFAMLILGWWFHTQRPWLPWAKRIWHKEARVGPQYTHVSWQVRFVFLCTYILSVLLYPEEIRPWMGWFVAIFWSFVLCWVVLDSLYYPWMRYQGHTAPTMMQHLLSIDAQRYIHGARNISLGMLALQAKTAFYRSHLFLYGSIGLGIFTFGLLIGEGRSNWVFLTAVMISAISWFTGLVNSIVTSTAIAAYEQGWVMRQRKMDRGVPIGIGTANRNVLKQA